MNPLVTAALVVAALLVAVGFHLLRKGIRDAKRNPIRIVYDGNFKRYNIKKY